MWAKSFLRRLRDNTFLCHAFAFGLLLILQLGLVYFRELPLVVADESVYLAHARYLSGAAHMPALHGAILFSFGYSLFLIPAFWLFDDPYSIYTASLAISALLNCTVYLSLYYVLASLLQVPSRLAIPVSLITCLFPPLFLRSNFAWAENAYVAGFMLLIALFGALLRGKSLRCAVLFGLVLGFMYAIHPRSLPLLAIAIAFIFAFGLARSLPWRTVIAVLLPIATVFTASRLTIEHLQRAIASDILEYSIRPILASLLSPAGLHDFALKVNEQILYVVHSSFGLFLVGAVFTAMTFWQRCRSALAEVLHDVPTATLAFTVLAWTGTLAVGAALNSAFSDNVVVFQGRYVDGISMVFLALGLVAVVRGWQRLTWRLSVALLGVLALSTITAAYSLMVFPPSYFAPHSLGIYPLLDLIGPSMSTYIAYSIIAAAGVALFLLARGRWRYFAVGSVTTLFFLTSAYGYFSAILPLQERVARSTSLAAYIRTYVGTPTAIAYDTAAYHALPYFTYEYLLPHTRLIPFDSDSGESPPAPIVIAGHGWRDEKALNAHFLQAEPVVPLVGADQALWLLPDAAPTSQVQQFNYANTVLGIKYLPAWSIHTLSGIVVQPIGGLWQDGLYHPSNPDQDPNIVFFDAPASLRIATADHPTQALLLNLVSTTRRSTPLSVSVNDRELFNDVVPPDNWCHLIPLPALPDAPFTHFTFAIPSRPGAGSSDVSSHFVVRGITLLDHFPNPPATLGADPLPPTAFRSQLSLASPPLNQPLARGVMGTVRVSVTNAGDRPWPTTCEIGQTPLSVILGILWFPADATGRAFTDRVAEGRATLPYALSPGDSITLTAIIAPFTPAGDPLPAGNYEVWIGPLQEGVAWFFQHDDDVLKLRVEVGR